jgi:hypothetical protein
MLKPGACYSMSLYGTHDTGSKYPDSVIHPLMDIKVEGIFDFEGHKHYAITVLTNRPFEDYSRIEPLYPDTKSKGYARIDEFDKYISPNLSQFSPGAPEAHLVKCLEVKDDGIQTPRFPVRRVGDDIDGWKGIERDGRGSGVDDFLFGRMILGLPFPLLMD